MARKNLKKRLKQPTNLFANQNAPAESLSVEDLEGMEGVVKSDFAKDKIDNRY